MTRAHAKLEPAALVGSGCARNALLLALTTIVLLATQSECASLEGPSPAARMVIEAQTPAHIVTGPEPTLTERFAASELARYIKAMTGKEIPVKTDETPFAGVTLAVGLNKYSRTFMSRFDESVAGPGPDSFVVSAKDGLVVLAGGADRGTLYSVYEFLEGQGCRWFFPGELGEYVPKKDRLVVPEGEKLCVPDFVQREIDGGARDPKRMLEIVDWAAKNRINRIFGIRAYHLRAAPPGERNAWAKRGGTIKWQWICHNLSWMIPPGEFKEHPKYFALYKGERVPIGTKGRRSYGGGNLCTTNEDVIRICAEFCIDWFDKNPDGAVVPINPNDGAVKWCECDNCRKFGGINFMGGKKGSMTRRMITFTNAIARRVYRRHPDRFLLMLAYSNYIEPEPDMTIDKNVIVQYAAHLDYAHAPDESAANEKARRQMGIWAKQANGNFGVWEYYLLGDFRSKKAPPVWLPLVYRTRDTVRYYKSLGARFYFTQSNYQYWDHNALVWYTLARLIWKTDTDFDALADDFVAKMYGPAARAVKELYRMVEESAQESDWCPTIYSAVAESSPKVFTRRVLERGDALLKQAERCKLDDKQRRRLAIVRESFDFTRANLRDAEAEWPKLAGGVPFVPKGPEAGNPARTPKPKEKTPPKKAPLKRGAKETRVQPLEGAVVFEKGKVGRCARFDLKSHLTFDSKYIKGNAGTVEAWVKLAADATDEELQFLFAVGANNPGWFMLTVGGGKIGFLYKNGRSPYEGRGEFYSNLYNDVRNLKKGSWHHVTYVWGYMGKAKSLKQIYLDGGLKAENYQASIGEDFRAKTLCVGYGGVRKKAFTGALDELRISNYPKTAGEIAASFEAGLAGKLLGLEKGTLLLLNFEGPAEAESATTDKLDNASVEKKIKAIIDRL